MLLYHNDTTINNTALALYSLVNTGIRQYQDYVAKVLEGHTVSSMQHLEKQLCLQVTTTQQCQIVIMKSLTPD